MAPTSPRERRQRPDQWEQPTSPPATADDAAAYQPGDDPQEGYCIAPSTGQQGEVVSHAVPQPPQMLLPAREGYAR